MIRKQTKLESNLIELNYKLSHKSYYGKHSEKVEYYVYIKKIGETESHVYLNKHREKIINFSIGNPHIAEFNKELLKELCDTYEFVRKELESIYDFEKYETIDLDPVAFGENEPMTDFVEESAFDD